MAGFFVDMARGGKQVHSKNFHTADSIYNMQE